VVSASFRDGGDLDDGEAHVAFHWKILRTDLLVPGHVTELVDCEEMAAGERAGLEAEVDSLQEVRALVVSVEVRWED